MLRRNPARRELTSTDRSGKHRCAAAAQPVNKEAGEMNIKKLLVDFVTVFAVTLIICALVTLIWNFIVHGTSTIDWETSFRFAIVFGIIFPWMEARRSKQK
jgi:hypothetical protein